MFYVRNSLFWQITFVVLLAWGVGMGALWYLFPKIIEATARARPT